MCVIIILVLEGGRWLIKRVCKLFCVLMVALMLLAPVTGVYAKKKTTTTTTTTTTTVKEDVVNVYVFYSPTCPHCSDLHEYLDELEEDKEYKDLFNVVDYDVVSSQTNYELWEKVAEYFGVKVDGVPFYVIGDQYYEGFGDSAKDTIKASIKNSKNDSNYVDVVDGIGKGEITGQKDDTEDKKGNNIVGMVILAITVVIIIILIVCSSKNKYYDDDEDDDDDEYSSEENKEEKEVTETKTVSSTKNNATKKTNTTKKNNNKATPTKNTKTTNKKKI